MTEPTAETPANQTAADELVAARPGAPVTPPHAKGVLSLPYRWLSIGMFSMIFLAAFEAMAVTTIMPLVADDLDGEALFALAFAVPLAAGIIGMVIAGNWTDRAGPLPSLITSAVLFVVGLVIAGTATDMVVFIVGRFVHGLSGAAVIVPLYVIVARVYPEQLRARVFAGFAAAWVIPSIIGPALAGVVAEAFSWHWVFLGVIGLLVPAAGMMLPPILRVRDQVQGDASVQWSLGRVGWSVLTAAAALTLSLSKEFADPWRWIIAVVSIALVVVAVRPLMPAGTLRAARGLPATVLLRLIVAGAFFGSEIYLPYLFIERYEFSPSLAGAVLTGAGVSWAVASWLQGRLGDRVSNTQAVQIGAGLLAVALAGGARRRGLHAQPDHRVRRVDARGRRDGIHVPAILGGGAEALCGVGAGVQQRRPLDRRIARRGGRARGHGARVECDRRRRVHGRLRGDLRHRARRGGARAARAAACRGIRLGLNSPHRTAECASD